MSYGIGAALQAAVYQRLRASSALDALIGDAIYDAVPPGTVTGTYVSLGPEDVRDASDVTGDGAEHDFVVSVVTDAAGFQSAKAVAAARVRSTGRCDAESWRAGGWWGCGSCVPRRGGSRPARRAGST